MVSACKGCPSFDGQSSSPFRCARFGILFPDTWIGNYYDLAIDSSFFREAAQRCNNVRLHLPGIALTAHAMKGDEELFLNAGVDGYLAKLIRRQELDDILAKYMVLRKEAGRAITGPSDPV